MATTRFGYAFCSSLLLAMAACTITTGPGDERERTPWGSGGSGGQNDGSDAGGSGGNGGEDGDAGPGGSGGSGGEDPGDGGQCVQSPSAGECEACAFTECEAHVCNCKADPECRAALASTDYFACLDEANGDSSATEGCDLELLMATESDDSADLANELGMCLHGNSADENVVGCPLECGT